eukprot:CAMPEP_0196572022 /NCGR_PEP_ID=MMETSP1081-20130531/2145_1 /TAXON_ID=36882 /ORGANISM="Pyramimonas amylifera, Strain CCMP720" /LENGTH=177 /DNA_ID=CAMNT_0041889193 /DNA_START=251 /DNA_END=781 /DNA_ORIENTATION=+
MLKSSIAGAVAVIAAHATFSGISIANAFNRDLSDVSLREDDNSSPGNNKCVECSREAVLTRLVNQLYNKGQADRAMFSDHASFEDPAMQCNGYNEIKETFRALQALKPQQLTPPILFRGYSKSSYIADLHSQYKIGASVVELHSQLSIELGTDGKVLSIEERWNRVPLIDNVPFKIS